MTLETFGQFVCQLILLSLTLESKIFDLNYNIAQIFLNTHNYYLLVVSVIYGFISMIGTRQGIESSSKEGFFPGSYIHTYNIYSVWKKKDPDIIA